MPTGQGIWPAFWLLGYTGDPDRPRNWPGCGEIDVIELINVATHYYQTIHGPQSGPPGNYSVRDKGPIADLSTDFHTYWTTRAPNRITLGIDDATLGTFTRASLPSDGTWVFNDNPMYAILNVAIGGDWAGPSDDSTQSPATMLVDWFRWDPA
jgi:beta-glucanase (GH16 family)